MGGFLAGGGPNTPNPMFAAPNGSAVGSGHSNDPWDLATALGQLASGITLKLMDGIFETAGGNWGASGATIQADAGARPIVVGADGAPPAINILAGTTVKGVWFGGTRPADETNLHTITVGNNVTVKNCTMFNYINGIQDGSGLAVTLRGNRLVRCGQDILWHPIYVATGNSDPAGGTLTELCILVGCFGYSIQYYHEPGYGVVRNNFIGDASHGLAIEGDTRGPINADHNIIWSVAADPLFDSLSLGSCDRNVWRGCSKPLVNAGGSFDGNHFVGAVPTNGTNPTTWQESDVVSNFGQSSATIDAAIAALEASFAASVATIHADSTIEPNFALLAGVTQTWAGQP